VPPVPVVFQVISISLAEQELNSVVVGGPNERMRTLPLAPLPTFTHAVTVVTVAA
jgi:hypothetical protein